jgi:hypothetical protein
VNLTSLIGCVSPANNTILIRLRSKLLRRPGGSQSGRQLPPLWDSSCLAGSNPHQNFGFRNCRPPQNDTVYSEEGFCWVMLGTCASALGALWDWFLRSGNLSRYFSFASTAMNSYHVAGAKRRLPGRREIMNVGLLPRRLGLPKM